MSWTLMAKRTDSAAGIMTLESSTLVSSVMVAWSAIGSDMPMTGHRCVALKDYWTNVIRVVQGQSQEPPAFVVGWQSMLINVLLDFVLHIKYDIILLLLA